LDRLYENRPIKRKRRIFTPEIKSKIALEAMKSEKTINEIAQLYEVNANQMRAWKGDMIANTSSAFDRGKRINDQAEQSARTAGELYKKIDELSMDVEFLKKLP
jgi:transposase-like protein